MISGILSLGAFIILLQESVFKAYLKPKQYLLQPNLPLAINLELYEPMSVLIDDGSMVIGEEYKLISVISEVEEYEVIINRNSQQKRDGLLL